MAVMGVQVPRRRRTAGEVVMLWVCPQIAQVATATEHDQENRDDRAQHEEEQHGVTSAPVFTAGDLSREFSLSRPLRQ